MTLKTRPHHLSLQTSIRSQLEDAIQTKRRILETLVPEIEMAADLMLHVFRAGNKVLFFGNGGSASDAQHLAAEFVCRYEREREALPAIALTTDTSILTAVSNDYAFERLFSRQIEALGRPGDLAVGITTSGRSANVLKGLAAAREAGLKTLLLTGEKGRDASLADCVIAVPSPLTSRIQESHILIGHILCDWIDRQIAA